MSNKREIKKQVISKQDLLDYMERGPKHFHDDIVELTNMCQTLFERMFDLYDDNMAAKIAQLKFQLTITINEETVVPLLSENNNPMICDWSFGCSGPLDKEEAEEAEKEMQL